PAPAPAASFRLLAPSGSTTDTPFDVTISAMDLYRNIATGYSGNVPALAPGQVSGSRASGRLPKELPGGTVVDPGAVISASWTSQLATLLLDEEPAVGAGATFLSVQPLSENSLDPDLWRVTEPTRADQVFHGLSKAPATSKVLNQDFADVDDGS